MEKLLRSEGPYVCMICDRVFKSRIIYNCHINLHPKNKVFTCFVCNTTFSSNSSLKEHQKSHIKIPRIKKSFKCDVCSKNFTRKFSLKKHFLKQHKGKSMADSENVSASLSNFNFQKSNVANCKAMSSIENIPQQDKQSSFFQCNTCEKKFSCKKYLKRHMLIHDLSSNSIKYKCQKCNKEFAVKRYLRRHLLIHNNSNINSYRLPHKCLQCDKEFDLKKYLDQHTMKCHGTKVKHKCLVCGKELSSKYLLKCHEMLHSGKRPFVCSTCGKSFYAKRYLQFHIRCRHFNSKFSCTICHRTFAFSSQLKKHYEHHANEKFKCNICEKKFFKEINFKIHYERHFQENLPVGPDFHKCYVCNRTFKEKYFLVRHLTIHSQEPSHACNICNERFYIRVALRNHRKEMHRNVGLNKPPKKKRRIIISEKDIQWKKLLLCCDSNTADAYSEYFINLEFDSEDETNPVTLLRYCQETSDLKDRDKNSFDQLLMCHICQQEFTDELTLIFHMSNHIGTLMITNETSCFSDVMSYDECDNNISNEIIFSETISHFSNNSIPENSSCLNKENFYNNCDRELSDQYSSQFSESVSDFSNSCIFHKDTTHLQHFESRERHPSQTYFSDEYTQFEQFLCVICNTIFFDQTTYNFHVNTHILHDDNFISTSYDKLMNKKISTSVPTLFTSENKIYSCTKCEKIFNSEKKLVFHYEIHKEQTFYSCSSCERSFRYETSLKKHHKITHPSEAYQPVCDDKIFI